MPDSLLTTPVSASGPRLGGQRLVYDPAAARVTLCGGREAEANQLLTREYRAGYELPYRG